MVMVWRRVVKLAVVVCVAACVRTIPTRTAWQGAHGARADAHATAAWEREFDAIEKHGGELQVKIDTAFKKHAVPASKETLKRLQDGRDFLLAYPTCSNCWKWDEVLEDARVFLEMAQVQKLKDESTNFGEYNVYSDSLNVNPTAVSAMPIASVASLLAHELTHRVFWQELLRYTKFTRFDVLALIVGCKDFESRLRLATEGVAYFNQLRWGIQNGVAPWGVHEAAMRWAYDPNGTQKNAVAFANFVFESRYSGRSESKRLICGPPVIIRRPNRGTYFDPYGLAPEILTSLFSFPSIVP